MTHSHDNDDKGHVLDLVYDSVFACAYTKQIVLT